MRWALFRQISTDSGTPSAADIVAAFAEDPDHQLLDEIFQDPPTALALNGAPAPALEPFDKDVKPSHWCVCDSPHTVEHPEAFEAFKEAVWVLLEVRDTGCSVKPFP
jgi:hypothetical protein